MDDVPTRFNTSGYCDRPCADGMGALHPLPIGMNEKVIGLMKDKLGGEIMTEFIALRPELYSFTKLDGTCDKKCKEIKKCVVKKTLSFDDYKNSLLNSTTAGNVYRSQLMFRLTKHEVHTVKVKRLP